MTLYALALILVVFGVLMAALDVLLLVLEPSLLARLSGTPIARQARAIFMVRYAPAVVAFLLTLTVVVPAWLRFEPAQTGERASVLLIVLACVALVPLAHGLYRAIHMLAKTRARLLAWQGRGRASRGALARFQVVEVDSDDLALCVGGYLRPTIYASMEVVQSLEPEEFSAAVAHEVSHANSRDPLRLLGLAACPDFLPLFRGDGAWRSAFAKACESAADAGASRGDPEVALDLASALLKVARLGTLRPLDAGAMVDIAVASAFSSCADLEARIEALVNPVDVAAHPGRARRPWIAAAMVAALFAMVAAGALGSEQVHAITEELGRVLAR